MKLFITNKSTIINEFDYNILISTLQTYIRTLSVDWGISTLEVSNSDNGLDSTLPNTIIIFDSIDDPISSNYNFEFDQNSIARVFAKTIIDSGGSVLNGDTTSIAQQLSGLILGLVSNYDMNKWYMDPNKVFWWGDISSPVYGNNYIITTEDGAEVTFADYVLPSYFGPNGKEGPFNKNNTLMGPFSVDEYGYSIKVENNYFTATFGPSCQQEIIDRVNIYVEEFKSRFVNL